MLDELSRAISPMLVVIEDAHWADEATLDLLKFLGRRIERTRALLVVTFRDDELHASHPLRQVIGELQRSALTRVELEALSPAGVELLARRALRSPGGLFAATEGNPFFLTELLRHPVAELPRTVQDLVLARFARLSKPAQEVLRLAAIVPGRLEMALLDAMLAPSATDLESCIDGGLLLADPSALRFRHELARVAVEAAIPAPVARALHAQMLRALEAGDTPVPSARLAHHAAHAGDAAAVGRYAPLAGDEASARGAHREAARHYRAALAQARPADDAQHQRWLEACAQACQRIGAHDEAIAGREALDRSYRDTGDVEGEGRNLSQLAHLYVHMLRNADGDAASLRAIALLEALPPGPALAAAYGIEATLRMLDRDCAQSAAWSAKAIELARRLDDRAQLCASLGTLGTALLFIDYDAGRLQMDEALAMARAEAMPVAAANAMMNLGSASGELMRFDVAVDWLQRALVHAAEHELDASASYSGAWLALCDLHGGRWDDAAERAGDVLARPHGPAISRAMAMLALGRVRLRRGDPGADTMLDDALALAGPSNTLQRIAPLRAARAEAALARGDKAAAAEEARHALARAIRHRHPWFIGELAFWSWRAGTSTTVPADCAEPFAMQIEGRWRDAADAWARLGCPYEQARALADGDEAARRQALAIFEGLGARPAAAELRRRLQLDGVRGIPRGSRASTRGRLYGLTTRELEILTLMCEGFGNGEIAGRLSRSVRTVDHHVAAVYGKLGVGSRIAAIQLAQRSGLAPPSGQAEQTGQSGQLAPTK